MSIEVMTLVYKSGLDKAQKAIALAYADHAHDDGTHIYPSVDYVAWKTGYSRRSVQTTTKALVESGILVIEGAGPSGTNRYKMDFKMLPKRPPYEGGAKSAPPCKPRHEGVQNLHRGVQTTTHGGANPAPKPSLTIIEPSIEYMYDGHEENTHTQEYQDVITAICNVVRRGTANALAPSADLQNLAHDILDAQTAGSIPGFTEWWATNSYYDDNGKPAFKSFLQDWDNYLNGVTRKKTNSAQRKPQHETEHYAGRM